MKISLLEHTAWQRLVSIAVLSIVVATLLCISIIAADELVLADFDLEPAIDRSIVCGEGISETVTYYAGDEHGNALYAVGENADSSIVRTVSLELASVVDLSDHKSIAFSICVDSLGVADNSCFLRVILHGDMGETHESIIGIEAGKWCDLSVDISRLALRERVKRIEFGVVPDHIDDGIWQGGFSLDNIRAADPINSTIADRFCFEDFSLVGADLAFAEDKCSFDLSFNAYAQISYIAFNLPASLTADDDRLRIGVREHEGVDSFTVTFLYGEDTAPIHRVQTLSDNDEKLFLIETECPEELTGLRLEFPSSDGHIRISSIEFTSSYKPSTRESYGSISRVELSTDKKTLGVTGTLPREYVTKFSDCELELYALELGEDSASYDFDAAEPIARHGISTKFKFTVSCDELAEAEYKKYVVMISSVPKKYVDAPMYPNAATFAIPRTSKIELGVCADTSSLVTENSSRTIVDVRLDKLISAEHSGYIRSSHGSSRYFEKSYVDELDRELGALKLAGVDVTLRLTIGSGDIERLTYGSMAKSEWYLANIVTREGFEYYRAAVEFLAERYIDTCPVADGFIIGRTVNAGDDVCFAPKMTLSRLTRTYADIMRLTYIASAQTGARIYASLGDVFEYDMLGRNENRYDTSVFISALGDVIADEGSFPWGICIECESDERAGRVISLEDTDTLDELYALLFLKKIDSYVPIMMTEHIREADATEAARCAASRMLAAASYGKLESLIIITDKGEENEKAIVDALRAFVYGDTQRLAALGVANDDYTTLVEKKSIDTRARVKGEVLDATSVAELGSYVYFDFNSYSQADAAILSHGTREIRLVPMQTGSLALRAGICAEDENETVGFGLSFERGVDPSYTPIVTMEVMLGDLPEGYSEEPELCLRFVGEGTSVEYECKLLPFAWQSIAIELDEEALSEGFVASCLEITPVVKTSDPFTLYIDDIVGHSNKYDSEKLSELIVGIKSDNGNGGTRTLLIIAVTAFVSLTLLLLLILERPKKNDRS